MAKENNDISDLVRKCKNLLLDIEGTTTSISFVKDKLFPYAEEKVKGFLEKHWETENVKRVVAALRKQATEEQEKSVDGFVAIPGEDASKDEQIDGLVKNVKWQMSADRKVGPLKQLQGLIWKEGYDNGDLKGHVYDDVSPALEQWRATDGQKVFIYSSGSVQAQKLLFQRSMAGDMLPLIDDHFDTAVGTKQDAASYAAIAKKIGCKAEEILFLTDIVKEAEAARASGLQVALVSREGNKPLPAEATAAFTVIHSFEQLALTNKRKPEPQVEEVPAKVPKTDVQDDVKTGSEMETDTAKGNGNTATGEAVATVSAVDKSEEPEKMEVEETPDTTAVELKADSAAEPNTAVAAVSDITDNDVAMEDADTSVSTEVKASVDTAIAKADSTENTVVKVDTTENAPTVETVTKTDIAKDAFSTTETVDVKTPAEIPKVVIPTVEMTVEAPKVPESKEEGTAAKLEDKVEVKAKMVDAATLTEKVKIVETSAVDAATETPTEVELSKTEEATAAEIKSVEAPIEEPKDINIPAVETTSVEPVVDASADNVMEASATEPEEQSAAHPVESNKIDALAAESKIEKADMADSKTEDVTTTVETKPQEAAVGEASEANAKVSNGTQVSNSVTAPVAEALIEAKIESKENGNTTAEIKTEEITVETVDVNDQKEIADVPAIEIEPVIEETGEKTEPHETEKMETEVVVTEEKVETVTEPKEPTGKVETAMETATSTVEIKDITDDKQSLSEVTETIDDVVPIVEEPSSNLEEMEELQNAGDVLEKECDEILSKVQDVTNLDFIPVKPLHTIAEEMETENMDTNDIVERILDTEMELSIKPEEIDLNTVQEITELKTDTDDRVGKVEPGTEKPSEVEAVIEKNVEVSCDTEMATEKPNENKSESEVNKGDAITATLEPTEEKMETEVEAEPKVESENKVEAKESPKSQESTKDTDIPKVLEPAMEQSDGTEQKSDNKESEKVPVAVVKETKENEAEGSQDAKIDDDTKTKVNGKTNGDTNVKLNGDSSQEDDLKSRLTAENGKEKVNGSNGESASAEIGQGDNKVEAEIPDIKLKTVVTDEAHTPIEQPVEA